MVVAANCHHRDIQGTLGYSRCSYPTPCNRGLVPRARRRAEVAGRAGPYRAAGERRIDHRAQGELAQAWIGVLGGLVKVSVGNAEGKVASLTGVPAGGWIGEGSLLKREVRKYDIVALRDSVVARLPAATFDWLLDTSIPFNRYLLHQLNERVAQFIGKAEYDRLLDPDARGALPAELFNPLLYPAWACGWPSPRKRSAIWRACRASAPTRPCASWKRRAAERGIWCGAGVGPGWPAVRTARRSRARRRREATAPAGGGRLKRLRGWLRARPAPRCAGR